MSAIRSPLLLALASAFVLSLSASAQADGVTAFFLLENVSNDFDEGFFIVPQGPVENPDGCSNPVRYHSLSDAASPGNDERFSLALMALAAGREVRVALSGCNNGPEITSITVR